MRCKIEGLKEFEVASIDYVGNDLHLHRYRNDPYWFMDIDVPQQSAEFFRVRKGSGEKFEVRLERVPGSTRSNRTLIYYTCSVVSEDVKGKVRLGLHTHPTELVMGKVIDT